MTDEMIATGIEKFMSVYTKDVNSRYRSFDYVHAAFREHEKHSDDELAFYLFMYLASWGMISRGCFMLWKSYKFLVGVCEIVCEDRYAWLMDIDPTSDGFGEKQKEAYINDVLELKNRIVEYFTGKTYYDSDSAERTIQRGSVSDTLVGKILLGTLGCIPAYDRFVVAALRSMGFVYTISEDGLSNLVGFAEINKAVFAECREKYGKENGVDYPVMKYVDMALWEYGKTLSRK